MARPEDTLARGNTRNGPGYDQAYDDQQPATRRDPRRPFDQRAREEPPLRSGATQSPLPPRGQGPGLNPQFDPYVPPQAAQAPRQGVPQGRPVPQDQRPAQRPDPRQNSPQQQSYAGDPYGQSRTSRPAGQPAQVPNGQAPIGRVPLNQAPANPVADRYAGSGEPGLTGRPVQAARQSVPGYPPPIQPQPLRGTPQDPQLQTPYDAAPASGRAREPFFAAPASGRRSPLPAQPQDAYGQDPYAPGSPEDARFEEEDDDEDNEEQYDEDPAPRGRRWLYAVAAIVSAVLIGGGAPYAYYKVLGGSSHNAGNPEVVQADTAPVKAVPVSADQGGDPGKKSILERADGGSSTATPPAVVPSQEAVAVAGDAGAQGDSVAGPRKVATVVVKPGQQIDAAAADPAGADTAAADTVPGISIDGADPASKPVAAAPKMKPTQPQAMVAAPDAVPPEPQADDGTAAADPAPAQAPIKLGKPAKKVKMAAAAPAAADATATDAVPPDPTLSAKPASTGASHKGGSGYLIQVRSTKTQTEALAYFADLQQRFGDLLGSAQPDIQEADLGAKGTWYRLRIGPPGSGAAAKDLCTKLKASGLDACIVAPY